MYRIVKSVFKTKKSIEFGQNVHEVKSMDN